MPLPDDVPTELEVAGNFSSETSQEVSPIENIIIDTFEYVEFVDGLPDRLINISGLIKGIGSMPKPFLATVKANMYIEGFVENFAIALGLDDYLSKLCGDDFAHMSGLEEHASKFCCEERRRENILVAALCSPIYIAVEMDPFCGSEEECNDSNSGDSLPFLSQSGECEPTSSR